MDNKQYNFSISFLIDREVWIYKNMKPHDVFIIGTTTTSNNLGWFRKVGKYYFLTDEGLRNYYILCDNNKRNPAFDSLDVLCYNIEFPPAS